MLIHNRYLISFIRYNLWYTYIISNINVNIYTQYTVWKGTLNKKIVVLNITISKD